MDTTKHTWAIVELLGHRTRAGRIAEIDFAGAKMLQIDIPVETPDSVEDSETEFVTEIYGGAAIYSVCPTDEAIIRAQHYGRRLPVHPNRYAESVLIAAPRTAPYDDDKEYDDDEERPFR